jgi:two-component system CheB/CheR fusion protein
MPQQKLPLTKLSVKAGWRHSRADAPASAQPTLTTLLSLHASHVAELERELEAARAELEKAKAEAAAANLAKSRFLAAASHDLRQPLQTLELLQSLLATAVVGDKAVGLVKRQHATLNSMSWMLDTLRDLNQTEDGIITAELEDCEIGKVLDHLYDELNCHAQAKGVGLSVVPCSAVIRTDKKLLGKMLRSLVMNALKSTDRGRVLLGCRGRGSSLRIEIWDTGIGISACELQAMFDDYHQAGNEARMRAHGPGLGLSIVHRLSALLDHPVTARSKPGKGSVFHIDVPRVPDPMHPGHYLLSPPLSPAAKSLAPSGGHHSRHILVVEDDLDVRDLLRELLEDEGYEVDVASTGQAAVAKIADISFRPGLIITDYNLPGGMTGLQIASRLRESLADIPVIILSGGIPNGKRQDVARQGIVQLTKPVKRSDLIRTINALLPHTPPEAQRTIQPSSASAMQADAPIIFVVDDDRNVRAALRAVLEDDGQSVEEYSGSNAFLAALGAGRPGVDVCLLVDATMPDVNGLELLEQLTASGRTLPSIVITGHGDVAMAVRAMKAGALDFIEKPVRAAELLASVAHAIDLSRCASARSARQAEAESCVATLTTRQLDVMAMVLAGHPSKNIAADLGISQRTVENHRASIMRKTGVRSLPALARLALAAAAGKAA